MFNELSIDELVERAQEAEADDFEDVTQEIARRFREGIGVEADPAEAELWERTTHKQDALAGNENQPAISRPEKTVVYTRESCQEMSTYELYRGYRKGAPWAIYNYAKTMILYGEEDHALDVLEELVQTIEKDIECGGTSPENVELLGLAKLHIARIYDRRWKTQEDYNQAKQNYEDAIELGCAFAHMCLLLLYRRNGGYKKNEANVLPLLRLMEERDDDLALQAAEAYKEMGYYTHSIAIYQEKLLLSGNSFVKLRAAQFLWGEGLLDEEDIIKQSESGEGYATLLLGKIAETRGNYNEAEKFYRKAMDNGFWLDGRSGVIRVKRRMSSGTSSQDEKKVEVIVECRGRRIQ